MTSLVLNILIIGFSEYIIKDNVAFLNFNEIEMLII